MNILENMEKNQKEQRKRINEYEKKKKNPGKNEIAIEILTG